ncbi:hypothetical protein [Neokomagataea thailandica]|uniref:Transposase n=1 Tax=Neokomagataea tanensis NBRC 106556 TaxID=1223519 RepID=A0ABQ0QFU0_9PROT|nr:MULTISPECIES: hypothetical protein [Neokomagataea]GBR43203.1 hypothetical protein AA106556_0010 [Neokomagataea tanensis NBRC 106556]
MLRDEYPSNLDNHDECFVEKNKARLERIARRARDWMSIYAFILRQRRDREVE